MNKIPYLLALLFTASLLFFYYSRDNENNDNGNPPGIGNPTPTTDPGVLIGEIDGEPIRWATRNVYMPGTFAPYPHSAGRLFQWGTLDGVTHHFDNTTLFVIDGWHDHTTASNRVAWTAANDPCPTGWRVPIREELVALHGAGISDLTELSGVNGRFFGTGTNRIFLPAARLRDAGGVLGNAASNVGYYWGNTASSASNGWNLWFIRSDYSNVSGYLNRAVGISIRCVAE